MCRLPLLFLLCSIFLFASNEAIPEEYSDPSYCFTCHTETQNDWGKSWHSNSHYDKNPLYKAMVNFVAKERYSSVEETLVSCGQCHNPRMSIKNVDQSFMLSRAFKVESKTTKEVQDSLNDTALEHGISCYICHNVDKIDNKNRSLNGYEKISWGSLGIMYGPYGSDERDGGGFHLSQKREHFINSDKLCMVCHDTSQNYFKLDIYETGKEYRLTNQSESCISCHMKTLKKGVVAEGLDDGVTKPILRDIKSHAFGGARNSEILKETLDITHKIEKNSLIIQVSNLTPHKAPTGFADRVIELVVEFKKDGETINTQNYIFGTTYTDKKGQKTVAYVARKLASDTRLLPYDTIELIFAKPQNSNEIYINASYRLISKELYKLIGLDDTNLNKSFLFFTKTIKTK
ncbi:MAG: hypothetical protein ACK5LP_00110 [Campylobacteraceae bacterium]